MESELNESTNSVLQGSDAKKALDRLIEEIDRGELEELTFQQAMTLEKLAKILIAAIDQEDTTVWASLKHSGSLAKLKKSMLSMIEKITESHPEPNDRPSTLEKTAIEVTSRKCI